MKGGQVDQDGSQTKEATSEPEDQETTWLSVLGYIESEVGEG